MTTSTDELSEITAVVSDVMKELSSEADVRRASEPGESYDPKLWQALAEAGITGIVVDEAYGGAGLGPVELEAVCEEMGAALACSPFFSSCVLAAGLLQACQDQQALDSLAPGIAEGEVIATAALTGPSGTWTEAGLGVTATQDGHLDGTASYVTFGQEAAVVLVAAREPGGVGVYEVQGAAPGLTITPLQAFDATQRLARLDFSATPATRLATDGTWAPIQAALDLGIVALAGDQVGGARAIFERTIDYAKTRVQFGRTIGSFQAIKHMAADLYLELESAISAARHAAARLADHAPDAAQALALAGFTCAEAYAQIAKDAIFMHGGIGFTWEYPAHLYLRRARADEQLLGAPALYRDRYLTEMGG